jgi:hypothetical protein
MEQTKTICKVMLHGDKMGVIVEGEIKWVWMVAHPGFRKELVNFLRDHNLQPDGPSLIMFDWLHGYGF